MNTPHVVVGMSGGVDSSIAAYLLKKKGYRVTGVFMKNWEDDDDGAYCSARQDWLDVAAVADLLEIDIEAVNFSTEYKERVFANFLKGYKAGFTPNPDVLCNVEIKFNAFLQYALSLKANFIATGHYAQCMAVKNLQNNASYQLKKAHDLNKDQSYFLHQLNQYQLSKTLFPLGSIKKTDIRLLAKKLHLPNALKKDSTGICFIGERPFRKFLQCYLQLKPGPIKNDTGHIIGRHIGLSFYTIGQRKGLGIGGQKEGSGEAWFVAKKDLQTNTLYVVQGRQHPWLLKKSLFATHAHWIAGFPPSKEANLTVKIRYRQQDMPCQLHLLNEKNFKLDFNQKQWGITPGQYAVLYDGDICLGGGVICNKESHI